MRRHNCASTLIFYSAHDGGVCRIDKGVSDGSLSARINEHDAPVQSRVRVMSRAHARLLQ